MVLKLVPQIQQARLKALRGSGPSRTSLPMGSEAATAVGRLLGAHSADFDQPLRSFRTPRVGSRVAADAGPVSPCPPPEDPIATVETPWPDGVPERADGQFPDGREGHPPPALD